MAKPDAAGNVGCSLTFNFAYQKDDPECTIVYSKIEFSGPDSWEEYSEGDELSS